MSPFSVIETVLEAVDMAMISTGPSSLHLGSICKGTFLVDEIDDLASTDDEESSSSSSHAKSVRFSDHVQLFEVPCLEDFSDRDIERIWYSPNDYHIIKCMCKVTLRMMEAGVVDEDDPDFCERGLESKTCAGSRARYAFKKLVRDAVLDEQEEQYNNNDINDDIIAEVSMMHSQASRKDARVRGLRDEAVIYSRERVLR